MSNRKSSNGESLILNKKLEALNNKSKSAVVPIITENKLDENTPTPHNNNVNRNFLDVNSPSSRSMSPFRANNRSKLSEFVQNLSPSKARKSRIQKTSAEFNEETKESRVGKKLSSLTMKRVIIIVLLLLLIIPLFDSEYYFDDDKSFIFGLNLLVNVVKQTSAVDTDIQFCYEKYKEINLKSDFPLISIMIKTTNLTLSYIAKDVSLFRSDEFEKFSFNDVNSFEGIIDLTKRTQLSAGLNLSRTVLVCIVLTISALMFSKDVNDLALRPIEKMIEKINIIAQNPLASQHEQLINTDSNNEVNFIYNSIIKIGINFYKIKFLYKTNCY